MRAAPHIVDLRNKIGGFLAGYFLTAFVIFLFVVERWAHYAPTRPDQALGKFYEHNEHGSLTYFTAFQATSSALMFWSNFLAVALAIVTLPKRNIKVRRWGKVPLGATWKNDDQKGLAKSSAYYGIVFALLMTFVFGPIIVRSLNGHGIVLHL